jgi:hypothetical protein
LLFVADAVVAVPAVPAELYVAAVPAGVAAAAAAAAHAGVGAAGAKLHDLNAGGMTQGWITPLNRVGK